MNDIYQQIWNSDRHKFLVSPRSDDGSWLDPHADILLDEQIKAFGRRDLDLAKSSLFYRVDRAKLESIPTFVSLIKLLDNYRFDNRLREIVTKAEKAEVEQFLDDICQTEPLAVAKEYINSELNWQFNWTSFRQQLKSIWFDLYVNYFGDRTVADSSGFEHIFVGEGKYDYRPINKVIRGEISGYHSWVEFYLDEQTQRLNYLGHNYSLQGNLGVENPYVVTVQMVLQERSQATQIQLFKKRGCFFIGTSPECEIAMGTVAYYESLADYGFQGEKRRTIINGAKYDLALYRNTQADSSRGKYLRSFYPIFMGKA